MCMFRCIMALIFGVKDPFPNRRTNSSKFVSIFNAPKRVVRVSLPHPSHPSFPLTLHHKVVVVGSVCLLWFSNSPFSSNLFSTKILSNCMWMLELLGEVGGDIKANIEDYILLTSLGTLRTGMVCVGRFQSCNGPF